MELVVSLAAIHTTQMAVIHTLYDLCVHPEYLEPIREEIKEVLDGKGAVWDLDGFGRLWKLDSFMKESQRVNPPSLRVYHPCPPLLC
jgi:cytochrome P450